MPASRPNPKHIGELGEVCFLKRAVELGLRLSKPLGEAPYDYIIDNRRQLLRVQIKCTLHMDVPSQGYRINSTRSLRRPYRAGDFDFLVAYVIEHDAWYIIPLAEFIPALTLTLYPHRQGTGMFEDFRERWDLLLAPSPSSATANLPRRATRRRVTRLQFPTADG